MSVGDSNRVFFERSGTYRKATYGLIVLVFGSAGLCVLIPSAWHIANEGFPQDQWLGVVFVSVWTTGMLGIAAAVGWRFFFRPQTHSRIDGSGIQIDSKHWNWGEVEVVFFKEGWLCLHSRKLRGLDHAIHSLPRLSPEEAKQILLDLDDYLAEHFPEVEVLC